MSTPLFIREPTAGNAVGIGSYLGQDLSNPGAATFQELTDLVDEPTLIEEVLWSALDFSTIEAEMMFALENNVAARVIFSTVRLLPGSASLRASGRIKLNFCIPTNHKLLVAHSGFKPNSYVNYGIVGVGGIVR